MPPTVEKPAETLDEVVIRFAGDSGDGMQLTGSQFTNTSALFGNDLATYPDFPAEIRAPAGTLAGVSGFQVRFSSKDIHTSGDAPDVLVAMNPAALKINIGDLKPGGLLILNAGNFTPKDLEKAGYGSDPLLDDSLNTRFQLVALDLNDATLRATEGCGLSSKDALRCKNLLALGILYWVYSRPIEPTENWLRTKLAKKPEIMEANLKALRAGMVIAENSELFQTRYEVHPAKLTAGTYRNLMGNSATAMGLVAASQLSGLQLFLGAYPITPASDILHALSRYKNFGVVTFQAEDEIAGIAAAIGAAFAGSLAVTTTSGPGFALKTEALGLAAMTELPLVVIDVQRAGPSTGMPTKTEQSDLLMAIFGRPGECPLPVLAPCSPSDCFATTLEAARLAVTRMTPVILLSDGLVANGAEPFRIPDISELEPFPVQFATPSEEEFQPYKRDPKTLARPWAIPGTAGLEHRIGGLEKEDVTGEVCYEPENHERMVVLRAEKVRRIADTMPPLEIYGDSSPDLLLVGWGSSFGSIRSAVDLALAKGLKVAQVHPRYVWPLHRDLGDVLRSAPKVLCPENNSGHFARLLRSEYLVDVQTFSVIQGRPFLASEILERIREELSS